VLSLDFGAQVFSVDQPTTLIQDPEEMSILSVDSQGVCLRIVTFPLLKQAKNSGFSLHLMAESFPKLNKVESFSGRDSGNMEGFKM
jgi:hypothetical protein